MFMHLLVKFSENESQSAPVNNLLFTFFSYDQIFQYVLLKMELREILVCRTSILWWIKCIVASIGIADEQK
jgi:hypothetical protein